MATIKQGILGGFSGKIGNVVGSSWKGIAVMKTKPLSVANPRTAAHVSQREDFADVVELAKQINSQIIKPLWDRFASKMSGYNAFVRENIGKFKPGSDLASKVKISIGQMDKTEIGSFSATADVGRFDVTWTDDSGEGFKQATDEAFVLVFGQDGNVYGTSAGSITRDTEGVAILSEKIVEGDTYYARLAFRRADGTIVSETSMENTVGVAS